MAKSTDIVQNKSREKETQREGKAKRNHMRKRNVGEKVKMKRSKKQP